jgi:hypothetical protein
MANLTIAIIDGGCTTGERDALLRVSNTGGESSRSRSRTPFV